MPGKKGMTGDGLGGRRSGSGRKSAPIGTIILDANPMHADVFSGATHRPREWRRGGETKLAWLKQTHAWKRVVGLLGTRRTAAPVLLAWHNEPATEISERVEWARTALGFPDSVWKCGQVLVCVQSDGTRAALTDV